MTPTLRQFMSLIEQAKVRCATLTMSMPRYRRMLLPVLFGLFNHYNNIDQAAMINR